VNFPEPSPDEPHPAPPPSRKWSGSLARAIPSPHQLKRQTGPVPVTPLPGAPAAPGVPGPVKTVDIPTPSLHVGHAGGNGSPASATSVPRSVVADAPSPAKRTRRPLLSGAQLYALSTLLLALAIIAAIVASRHPAKSPLSKITLTSGNVYVLVDQPSIKAFEDDMRNSPVAESLEKQMDQATDPALVQRLNIGLQQEISRHSDQVTQEYLRSGKAKIIEPGTYSTVAFFDDDGVLTAPRAGAPWVAILYHGNVVYAFVGAEFKAPSQ
jgi:hypothetical protein